MESHPVPVFKMSAIKRYHLRLMRITFLTVHWFGGGSGGITVSGGGGLIESRGGGIRRLELGSPVPGFSFSFEIMQIDSRFLPSLEGQILKREPDHLSEATPMKSANTPRLAHPGKPLSQARAEVGVGDRPGQGLQGARRRWSTAGPVATQTGRNRGRRAKPRHGQGAELGRPLPPCPPSSGANRSSWQI